MNLTKKLIGQVAVDSGQLMLVDPCYVDSGWKKTEFEDVREYVNEANGDRIIYRVHFPDFEYVLPNYDKTVNDLIADGTFQEAKKEPSGEFSYNGCCQATLTEEGLGQLEDVTALTFRTYWGDGLYDVHGWFDRAGGMRKVEINLYGDSDDEE